MEAADEEEKVEDNTEVTGEAEADAAEATGFSQTCGEPIPDPDSEEVKLENLRGSYQYRLEEERMKLQDEYAVGAREQVEALIQEYLDRKEEVQDEESLERLWAAYKDAVKDMPKVTSEIDISMKNLGIDRASLSEEVAMLYDYKIKEMTSELLRCETQEEKEQFLRKATEEMRNYLAGKQDEVDRVKELTDRIQVISNHMEKIHAAAKELVSGDDQDSERGWRLDSAYEQYLSYVTEARDIWNLNRYYLRYCQEVEYWTKDASVVTNEDPEGLDNFYAYPGVTWNQDYRNQLAQQEDRLWQFGTENRAKAEALLKEYEAYVDLVVDEESHEKYCNEFLEKIGQIRTISGEIMDAAAVGELNDDTMYLYLKKEHELAKQLRSITDPDERKAFLDGVKDIMDAYLKSGEEEKKIAKELWYYTSDIYDAIVDICNAHKEQKLTPEQEKRLDTLCNRMSCEALEATSKEEADAILADFKAKAAELTGVSLDGAQDTGEEDGKDDGTGDDKEDTKDDSKDKDSADNGNNSGSTTDNGSSSGSSNSDSTATEQKLTKVTNTAATGISTIKDANGNPVTASMSVSTLSDSYRNSLIEKIKEEAAPGEVRWFYDIEVDEDATFPLTITLNLSGYQNQKVTIVHFVNGSEPEYITPVVTADTITFTLNSLSPVAVVTDGVKGGTRVNAASVRTGDEAKAGTFALLSLASGAVLFFTIRRRRHV